MFRHRAAVGSQVFDQYQRIQAFKADPNSIIDGVNYANVVAEYLYDRSIRHWLKMIALAFFFTARIDVKNTGRDLLNFYSHRYKKRRDYDFIVDYLVEIAGDRGDSVEVREVFSPTQWWFTLVNVRSAWRATIGYRAGLPYRLSTTALVAKYISAADRFYRQLVAERTRVFTFCDAASHDNLIAQLAKINGALTITAQHGQYRVLDERNMSSDAEAYANFVSDKLLCWGEATCREFERFGIERNRMLVTGWIRDWDRIKRSDLSLGTFGVMLNGGSGAESNFDLLHAANRVSEQLGLRFVVRLHPQCTDHGFRSRVSDRCTRIGVITTADYVSAVDFSIAHMSGATVEMLQLDSPVYVLDDGRLAEVFRHPGLSFSGEAELLAAIQKDRLDEGRGRHRTQQLKRWFNDDTDQEARVLSVMREKEA